MKKNILICLVLVLPMFSNGQDIFGKWKTIDDETGEEKSIVEIYRDNGKVYGKIVEILNKERKDALCTKCDGSYKNKPILGMVILKDMIKKGNGYEGGTIINPSKGKTYKCKIWLEDTNVNILNVRGYIAFLFATQNWERVIN
ncbi:DUF2147 domain-containing protein [Cognatitamlana onchidii]|uniref:DUF2147 domain-containing protein n=1 Tax=Cognatitamlana onchidii TaxID=2562860 RepID=UPI0010A64BEA|nr:DUF2147 domain-containing protein [Algibacter onchidii]